jgi:hypothetical protein
LETISDSVETGKDACTFPANKNATKNKSKMGFFVV